MRHIYIYFILAVSPLSLVAQPFFEWSAGAEGTGMTFLYMAADELGVAAVAETEALNSMRSTPRLLQAGGEESRFSGYSLNHSGQSLLLFDPNGKITHKIDFYTDYNSIYGVVLREHTIIILTYIEGVELKGRDWKGYLPTLSGEELYPAGYNLVILSREGKFKKSIACTDMNPEQLAVHDFRIHPNGSYLISGGASPGKPALNDKAEILGGGGDFIMMLDTTGKVNWVDVVSFRTNSCCSRLAQNTSLSIAPDGTFYFGGNYNNGGVFSTGLQTLAPQKYSIRSSPHEAYVISYTPKGKVNWLKVYEEQSVLFALQATGSGVYASHKTQGDKVFGLTADTTHGKSHGLTFLDKKGDVEWSHLYQSYKVYGFIRIDGQVYLAHTALRLINGLEDSRIAGVQLPERTQFVLSSINQKTHSIDVIKSAPFKLEERNEPILLTHDALGNIYVGGIIFCTLPLDLQIREPSLPPVECYGSVPVLGKVSLK